MYYVKVCFYKTFRYLYPLKIKIWKTIQKLSLQHVSFCTLKGVFAKNERGIGLMRQKSAFDRH